MFNQVSWKEFEKLKERGMVPKGKILQIQLELKFKSVSRQ